MKNVTIGKWLLMVLVLCLICMLPFLANAEVLPSDIEWETAKSLGWIDDTAQPDEPCSKDQFYTLMNAMVKQRTGKTCEWIDWQTGDPMLRLYVPRVLYEAAIHMGYSEKDATRQDIANINDPTTMMNSINIWLCGEQWRGIDVCPDYEEFCNDNTGSKDYDPDSWYWFNPGEIATFVSKQECLVNNLPVMELDENGLFRAYDAITVRDAVSAAFRLYCSFGDYTQANKTYQAAEYDLQSAEAVEIHFTSALLDKEIRRQLDLAEDDPIYDYQLKRITALSFAGDRLTDVWCYGSEFGENNYFIDLFEGVKYGGILTDVATNKTIELTGWEFENLDEFALFPNLERLTVCSQQVTDISGIAGLTKLRYLDLSQNHITDLSPLENLTELRNLFLFDNPFTEISALHNLHNLWTLNIGRTNTESLSGMEGLPIGNLNINSMACLTDISALARMGNLTNISCNGPRLYDASDLSAVQHLDTIEISYLNDKEAAAIGAMESLNRMGIVGIHEGELTGLTLQNCEALDIWWCDLDDLEWLHSDSLRELSLCGCYTDSLNGIGNLPALEALIMDNSATPDASAIADCPKIQYAQLSDSAFESVKLLTDSLPGIDWIHVESIVDHTDLFNNVVVSADPMPKPIGYTSEIPAYISIDEVAAYETGIITDELLALESRSALPDAGIGVSAYWIGGNHEAGWIYPWDTLETAEKTGYYYAYYYEDILERMKACGGNAMRYPLDYKWMNNNGPEWTIDSNRLTALDGLLEAAIRNDVHIQLTFADIPLIMSRNGVFPDEIFTSEEAKENYIHLLKVFSERYADIPNRYLDFELCPEAGTGGTQEQQKHQADTFIEFANAVWDAEGRKPREQKRLVTVTFVEPTSQQTERLVQNDISLYTHEKGVDRGGLPYTVYDASLGDRTIYAQKWTDWPLVSMPGVLWGDLEHNTLTFTKESGFPEGTTFEIWAELGSPLEIYADQNRMDVLYPNETTAGTYVQSYGKAAPMWKFALQKDTKSVRFVNPEVTTGFTTIYIVEITLPDCEPVRLYANFGGTVKFRNWPEASGEIRMADDLSCVGYVNGEETWFDAQYICDYLWMGNLYLAQKYHVNFQISEIYCAPPANDETLLKIMKDFHSVMQKYRISSMDKIFFDPWHEREYMTMPDGVPYYFDEDYYRTICSEYGSISEEPASADMSYRVLLDVCGELSLPKGQKIYAGKDTKSEVIYTTKAAHNNFFIAGAEKEDHDGWIPVVLPGEVVGWLPPNARTEWVSY